MGTTSFSTVGMTKTEVFRTIAAEATGGLEIVESARVGNVLFFAIRYHSLGVYAGVVTVEFRQNQVYYKTMDEFAGPFHSGKCPQKIMDMLSPLSTFDRIDPEFATRWRNRQQREDRPSVSGHTIVFDSGYRLGPVLCRMFFAMTENRKTRFWTDKASYDRGVRGFALTNWKKNNYYIVE